MVLILASASPRRKELLDAAGLPSEVRPVDVDETRLPGEVAERYVERVAALKADKAWQSWPERVILGADTAVRVGADVLGKPQGVVEAARMLRSLSGRTHEVLTGVALRTPNRGLQFVERTTVVFRELTDDDIAWYVESGEPMDKAGAYAIQGLGSRFVTRIDGSYSNVVGLPIAEVARALAELGVLASPNAR